MTNKLRRLKETLVNNMEKSSQVIIVGHNNPDYDSIGAALGVATLAKSLGVKDYEVITALDSMKSPVSIFEPIYNDGGDTIYLCDQIEDKKVASSDIDINLALDNAINDLEEREKYIIDERYIMGKTQMEIATELGISQAQISRLEKNAINTLKKVLK